MDEIVHAAHSASISTSSACSVSPSCRPFSPLSLFPRSSQPSSLRPAFPWTAWPPSGGPIPEPHFTPPLFSMRQAPEARSRAPRKPTGNSTASCFRAHFTPRPCPCLSRWTAECRAGGQTTPLGPRTRGSESATTSCRHCVLCQRPVRAWSREDIVGDPARSPCGGSCDRLRVRARIAYHYTEPVQVHLGR